jgi:hypothetical protein
MTTCVSPGLDMTCDRNVIWRIGEHHLRGFTAQQGSIIRSVQGIAASNHKAELALRNSIFGWVALFRRLQAVYQRVKFGDLEAEDAEIKVEIQ